MSFLSKIFSNKSTHVENSLLVDMHSHLLPGIDDGVDSYDEAVEIIEAMMALGYRKFITTPHIMADFYRNTPEIILEKLEGLRAVLKERKINVEVEAAAEYYMDDNFENLLKGKMLTWGKNYVLVETSYVSEMRNLNELIFAIHVAGYKPVLAHPERYTYMYDDLSKYKALFSREILFQVNISSLVGYYSPDSKRVADWLIKEKMVHFIGSDVHHLRHLKPITQAMHTSAFKQVQNLKLLNSTLL